MEKYNEILRLKEMLTQHQIPFDFSEFQGGYHICYPNKYNVICSVIEHDFSYGREKDKLEIQGLVTEEELQENGDTVLGYLTAEDVFARIKNHLVITLTPPNNPQSIFPEQDLEKTDLIKQLAKCSDRIKEMEKILCLSRFQDFMNEFPNITSPCKICTNYNNETYDTTKCIDCCYYYGSQFKIKEIK